ncbi:Xaa-Pro aminopeptidase [Aphanothece hegewaldii CCALA 016]|uniref:Xaa-Pro aminopeptidase n=1 Tax=Aphanothece hegewaldii CCALA 016 TaxID=2107694 RepID=A0A2T1LUV9_9CHRO|nr:aminopeptidase P family protein [Aphanothece hegewaldii]PSF35414.1 Xaa-Pro aminopeptidase [Aphanothece hegewaldii CCALA 016]
MKQILKQRRLSLAELCQTPVILWSGGAISRNFPANRYPFRASSHFLYFAGIPLENAAIKLDQGKLELFIDDPDPSLTLWHGETPLRAEIADKIGADAAYPLSELAHHTKDAATIPVQDPNTYKQQCQHLNRFLTFEGIELDLAQAIITLRLAHDAAALEELKKSASVAVLAHLAGMKASRNAKTEAEIRAAMESVIIAHDMTCAYNSIVTVHGEILHNEQYDHFLESGDLLLADVGAETYLGWASDITRTWPISGQFSPTQRDIYDVVLAAHDACIAKMCPGVEYREIHLLAARVMAEGLVSLGILQGDPDSLVEMDAHALFFPHGIGHLLGLDVHDMEDLGDLAGYENGRIRSNRFGLGYLRLDRPLRSQMLVTIEPGFYQVSAILGNPDIRTKYRSVVNWDKLSQFEDVRGIRIEDDVLITDNGIEVLTAALPTQADHIEEIIRD